MKEWLSNTTEAAAQDRVPNNDSCGRHTRVRISAGHNDSCCFQLHYPDDISYAFCFLPES